MSEKLDAITGDTLEEKQTPSEQEDMPDAAPVTMKNDAKVQREMQNSTSTESSRYDHSDVIVQDSILYRVSEQLSCETLFRFASRFLNLTIVDIENASDIVPTTVYEKVAKSLIWWAQSKSGHNAGRLKNIFKEAVGHGLLEEQVLDKTQEWKDDESLSNAHVDRIALLFTHTSWKKFASDPYLEIPDNLKAFEASENEKWFHLQSVGILKIWKNTPPAKTIGDLLDVLKKANDEGVVPRTAIDVIDSNYAWSETTDSMPNCSELSEPEKETLNLPVESTEEKIKRMGLESHRKNTTRNPRLNTRGSSHTRYEVHDSTVDVVDAGIPSRGARTDQATVFPKETKRKHVYSRMSYPANSQNPMSADVSSDAISDSGVGLEPDVVSESTKCKQIHAGKSDRAGPHNLMNNDPNRQSGKQHTCGTGSHNNQRHGQPSSDREQAATETEQRVDPADQQNTGENSETNESTTTASSSHKLLSLTQASNMSHEGKPEDITMTPDNITEERQAIEELTSIREGHLSHVSRISNQVEQTNKDDADPEHIQELMDNLKGTVEKCAEAHPLVVACGSSNSELAISYNNGLKCNNKQHTETHTSHDSLPLGATAGTVPYSVRAKKSSSRGSLESKTSFSSRKSANANLRLAELQLKQMEQAQQSEQHRRQEEFKIKQELQKLRDQADLEEMATKVELAKLVYELNEESIASSSASLCHSKQSDNSTRQQDSSYGDDGEICRDQPNQKSELRVVCTEPDKGITRESSTSPSLQPAKHLSDSTNSMSKQNSTSREPARPKRQRYKSLKKLFCGTRSSDSEHTQYYKNRPTNREPNS